LLAYPPVNNVCDSLSRHSIPQPGNIGLSSLTLYDPTTSAASGYLRHSLTAGLQEKVAAEGFEPPTKGLEKSETIAIRIDKQNRMSALSSVYPFPNPLPWFHLPT
jgi:hypothetical protein